ncbi:Uncharacterized protein Fot_50108 [Forsythia ovata]|uniref:Uncharacterized protein n=1 Tax=Forsythia ovata TaxID=205694 RepID=A0ABD1PY53_9LAMI
MAHSDLGIDSKTEVEESPFSCHHFGQRGGATRIDERPWELRLGVCRSFAVVWKPISFLVGCTMRRKFLILKKSHTRTGSRWYGSRLVLPKNLQHEWYASRLQNLHSRALPVVVDGCNSSHEFPLATATPIRTSELQPIFNHQKPGGEFGWWASLFCLWQVGE